MADALFILFVLAFQTLLVLLQSLNVPLRKYKDVPHAHLPFPPTYIVIVIKLSPYYLLWNCLQQIRELNVESRAVLFLNHVVRYAGWGQPSTVFFFLCVFFELHLRSVLDSAKLRSG
jgi:hypothetical protein